MKRSRDLLWLLGVLVAVALAVAYTPYEISLPRVKPAVLCCPLAEPSPVVTPDVFTMLCTGSRHAKAYTGFQETRYPQCFFFEVGLVDHP